MATQTSDRPGDLRFSIASKAAALRHFLSDSITRRPRRILTRLLAKWPIEIWYGEDPTP